MENVLTLLIWSIPLLAILVYTVAAVPALIKGAVRGTTLSSWLRKVNGAFFSFP